MKRWVATLAGLSLLAIVWLLPGSVHADVNNFLIQKFDAEYRLTTEDPQGKLYVKETLDVVFYDNNHGILRALPEKYEGEKLNLDIISVTKADGSEWPYTTYKQNGNLVLKIGDPNATVTGANRFVVEYSAENVVRFFDGYDELYWDINGDDWVQEFTSVTARVILPGEVNALRQACYTGSFGSTEQNCTIDENGKTLTFATTQPLGARQTLTVAAGFTSGVFAPPTWQDRLMDNAWNIGLFVLPVAAIGIPVARLWYRQGKDLPGRGVIVPQYDVPMGLSAVEMGAVSDYRPDNRDISAGIIDLAIRGYLRIDQQNIKKKLRRDEANYSFTLLKNDVSTLKAHEVEILKGIFGSGLTLPNNVSMKSLVNKFYTTVNKVRSDVLSDLTQQKFFQKHPYNTPATMIGAGAAIAFSGFFAGGFVSWGLGLGLIVAGLVTMVFGYFMPKRLDKGVAAKEHLEGLKLYLETAEKDRLAFMQGPQARYAKNVGEPERTVELFEKLLPAAIVLGVEKDWAKQFSDIYDTPPDWYHSSTINTFTAVSFVDSLNSSVSAMNSSFSAPSSSSGSGSGGGGSSGGGGGGGGGGGW